MSENKSKAMGEQQLNEQQLKMLQQAYARAPFPASPEHKEVVMKLAQAQAKRLNQHPTVKSAARLNDHWQHLSSMATAVVVTLAIFVSLHWVINSSTIEPSASLAQFEYIDDNNEVELPRETASILKKPTRELSRITLAPLRPLDSHRIAEVKQHQIALGSSDSDLNQQLIDAALGDIAKLIESGRFYDARERYEALKLACSTCLLPAKLDALTQASS